MALRTQFEVIGLGLIVQVLGIGLEASRPRELPCPRLEDSVIFCTVEILLENARNLAENWQRLFLFSSIGDRLKIFLLLLLMAAVQANLLPLAKVHLHIA